MSATTPDPPSPIEDTDASWPAMLNEWAADRWQRVHRTRDSADWPPAWLVPSAGIVGVLLVALLLVGLILPLIRWLATLVTSMLGDGADWLRDYLTTHAAGLPVTSETLWWTWCAAGIALFTLAFLARAVAARLGWILFGTATVAMVWAATPGPARTTAAGIAALWWITLSLLALRRPWSPPAVTVHLPELPRLAGILRRRE
ncbi:hypothetical protein [Micromonospora sp. WMMD1082]|uniref:hypothetical protein n=1 Tax=Micromonospora sp. WMMD1082 TaxID=3016104 RepID=UPI002415A536|nr:hypothetical protein [Micromonospora sp. WMMD1082]MDG4795204.1 hypothetical protein [Micromonospora sp. WMMD1082]